MKVIISFNFLLFMFLPIETTIACTSFNIADTHYNLFGKNYDWYPDDGIIIVNKRGLSKTSMQLKDAVGSPVKWKSKYGSITFNQYGREFPAGGINEAGLVVEALTVPGVEYSVPDYRPYIGKLQWRQYQLDNCRTVDEVIDTDSQVRITDTSKGPCQHYMVSDHSGNCAIITFIEGKMVTYTGKTLPLRVLSNSSYEQSLRAWGENSPPASDPHRSTERFFRVAKAVSDRRIEIPISAVDNAFDILKNVVQDNMTRWSIVYDIKNLQVFFRTPANEKIRRIEIQAMDFDCQSPVQALNVQADLSGDVTNLFQDYTVQMNRLLIGNAFGKTESLKGTPEAFLDMMAQYPEGGACEP
jgi:penicillin V acylase-like amidase (Ntn superfamily)